MIDKEAIKQRLEEIDKRLFFLQEFIGFNKDKFCEDPREYDFAIRQLQVAVEACMDIAKIIISSNGFDRPAELRDIFLTLCKKEIIDSELARKLTQAAGFRNIIVHSYTDIDLLKVYDYIQNDLKDLEEFSRQVDNNIIKKTQP